MHAKLNRKVIRGALVAFGLSMVGVGAASAGEWRIDPRKCPDLREDRRDERVDRGWRDRREDRRDQRVINCPARAYYWVRGPRDSRYDRPPPRPRDVYVDNRGRHYYRDNRGVSIWLRLG